jgi:hypothetical protein
MPIKKNIKSKVPKKVVSALVFDKQQETHKASTKNNIAEKTKKPITASVFITNESDLLFKIKLRNIIDYTFECIRDHLAEKTPITAVLTRSIEEMKLCRDESAKRLSAEALKYYHELIEELMTFIGDATAQKKNKDMNYCDYIRIAWLSHYILEDLKNSN